MIKYDNTKQTSKHALYFLTLITLTFTLVYGIMVGGMEVPNPPEIVREVRLNASGCDPNITGLTVVDCQNEVETRIREIAVEEDFKWADYAVRLTECESSHNPQKTNTEGNYPPDSIDRGLWQINNYWHYEVSDECAYDLDCSTRWSMNYIKNGNQKEWVCDKIVKNI